MRIYIIKPNKNGVLYLEKKRSRLLANSLLFSSANIYAGLIMVVLCEENLQTFILPSRNV